VAGLPVELMQIILMIAAEFIPISSPKYFSQTRQIEKENDMQERIDAVTMKGNPLTLLGAPLKAGDRAPDVELIDNDLQPVKLSAFQGKVRILSSVPSLDTPVCDMETRRFNSAAGGLGEDVVILTISMDLPFAQKRWCGAAGVDRVVTLSDHRDAVFGESYGVLIKGLRLLSRAIFVVDREGVVRYVQEVNEIAEEPDYDAVLQAAKSLL
jgi:thiol peroxidase